MIKRPLIAYSAGFGSSFDAGFMAVAAPEPQKSAMAPNNKTTAVGSNWNEADSKKLYEHFASGDFDPSNQDPKYIKECFDRTEWLQARTTAKKLYRNYRRHACIWLTEQGKNGARRKSLLLCLVVLQVLLLTVVTSQKPKELLLSIQLWLRL